MQAALPLISLATTAATGGAGAALFGPGILSTLSTAATVISAGSSILGGLQARNAARGEAAQIKQQVEIEKTRAAQEESNRQARLTQILGEGLVMSAGRGGTLGSGSDLAITDFSVEEARREGAIASLDSRFRRDQLRMQASQARKSGTASLISGLSNAASTVGTYAERRYERTRTK